MSWTLLAPERLTEVPLPSRSVRETWPRAMPLPPAREETRTESRPATGRVAEAVAGDGPADAVFEDAQVGGGLRAVELGDEERSADYAGLVGEGEPFAVGVDRGGDLAVGGLVNDVDDIADGLAVAQSDVDVAA